MYCGYKLYTVNFSFISIILLRFKQETFLSSKSLYAVYIERRVFLCCCFLCVKWKWWVTSTHIGLILKWHKIATSCFRRQLIMLMKPKQSKKKTCIILSIYLRIITLCEIRKIYFDFVVSCKYLWKKNILQRKSVMKITIN